MAQDMPSYPQLGEPLPVELVNTIYATEEGPVDGLSSPDELAAWLRANSNQLARPGEVDAESRLRDFRKLRAALRELFGAAIEGDAPPKQALRTLNRMSKARPTYLQLDWLESDGPRAALAEGADDAGTAALAEVASAAIELLGGERRGLIRACPAPRCVLYFVKDDPRRAWCSNTCGNRARVARHYRRHHPSTGHPSA
jgi:predicted RNA-binding Zn ribbon-like protein